MRPKGLGNYRAALGVYSSMRRGAAFVFLCCAAFGQGSQDDPLTAKLSAISQARSEGRSADAVALREDARRLLDAVPVGAPQFGGWVQAVAQLYSEGGWTARARVVLQAALDRTGRLGATSAARVQLLTAIAASWQSDQNLPKAVEYLEKAMAAQEQAPEESQRLRGPVYVRSLRSGLDPVSDLYQRLLGLQQELGHPDAVAALRVKLRELAAKRGDRQLALYLEGEERFGEAAAIYKRAAEQAASPQESIDLLQSLASVLERDEKFDEAIAAQQQVIARSEDREANNARQTLAQILQQAGHTEEAGAVYREMLAGKNGEGQLQLLAMYANFLASTNRGAQAITMLKEYQPSGGRRSEWEETVLFNAMANCARSLGDTEQTAKYEALMRTRQRELAEALPVEENLVLKAQSAANEGRVDEAFGFAMRALTENRDEIGSQIPSIAAVMASKGGTRSAEQLYQSAISLAESWSEDSVQPLLNLLANRVPALIDDPKRRGEARSGIERYREILIAAHGAESGLQEGALRMAIQLERPSVIPALDLAAFEESVNGGTSEPYVQALVALAETYEGIQDWEAAVKVRKRIVQLGDLVYPAGDPERGQTRVDLAMALANLGQFEVAEGLAMEAIAAGKGVRPTPGVSFEGALQQIRQMRAARK